MKKKSPIMRGYCELFKMRKSILPITVMQNILRSLQPFVYIIVPAKIIDVLSTTKDLQNALTLVIIGVVVNFIFLIILGYFNNLQLISHDIMFSYEKNAISKKLLEIDYVDIEDSEFSAKILRYYDEARFEGNIYFSLVMVVQTFAAIFTSIITAIFLMRSFWPVMFRATGQTFIESSWIGVILIIATIFIGVISAYFSGKFNKSCLKYRNQYSDINHIFDYYRNMVTNYKTGKEIRLFKQQAFIMQHATNELLTRGLGFRRKISNRYAAANGLTTMLSSFLAFGIYLLVGLKAQAGLFSIGDMIIYIGGFLQIAQACKSIAELFGQFKTITPKAQLYYEILDRPISHSGVELISSHSKHIFEFRNVSFRYSEQTDFAIKNLNLTINSNDKIAIVGENGSGKTTFVKLLCGLCYVTEGEIYLNEKDLKKYNTESLRSLFSVVFQDFHVFSLPLGENIASSNEVDSERAKACLKQVGFEKNYSLESYMYRDCDENGIEISGGEAQKIALARALYRNAPVVILDEPTAALDPIAEFDIYSNFNTMVKGKTAIFISHRLSACRFCDKIVVMDKGMLVQFDTHENLLKDKSGKYYELWNAQAKYYQNHEKVLK